MKVHDLPSPALVVDADAFVHNVATMAAALPGDRLRPHVKAFKSTALAQLANAGHRTFCCATPKEMEGMAVAGLGEDLLLANEVLGVGAERMGTLAKTASRSGGRVTVAVDSDATIQAAADAGVSEVLIDVNVGLLRCGCHPNDAGRLGDLARQRGMTVRGVMGYEGHLMREPAASKAAAVESSMRMLLAAHADVGGELVSAGGTGTYACNQWATEIQAGSYCLMDTEYVAHAPAFRQASTSGRRAYRPQLIAGPSSTSASRDSGWTAANQPSTRANACSSPMNTPRSHGATAQRFRWWAIGCEYGQPTSIRPLPTTSACTSSGTTM